MNYSTALIQLPLVRECRGSVIRSPADIHAICADLRDCAQEQFQVLTLNTKNRLINRHLISLGLADASLVHPREIFRAAISESATAVALVHNHPSGDTAPSAEDLRITRQLIEAGKIVDIRVLDHVIIGRADDNREAWLSLRDAGLCQFV